MSERRVAPPHAPCRTGASRRGARRGALRALTRAATLGWVALVALALAALVVAPSVGQAQSPPSLQISADALTWSPDGGWSARGNVRLTPGGSAASDDAAPTWQLQADRAELRGESLVLEGVVFTEPGRRLTAAAWTIDLNTSAATLTRLTWREDAGPDARVELSAEAAALSPDGRWTLEAVVLAPCACEGDPKRGLTLRLARASLALRRATRADDAAHGAPTLAPWGPLTRDASIEAEGVTLGIDATPLAPLPDAAYPLDGRRLGLLPPSLGWFGDDGALVGLSAFAPIGPQLDLTPELRWRSAGLWSGGLHTRFIQRDSTGQPRTGALTVQGYLDQRPDRPAPRQGRVVGSGALESDALPNLRYDLHLLTHAAQARALRLPLPARLGAPLRSGISVGERGDRATFVAGATAWQRLEGASGSLLRGATTRVNPEAAYTLRAHPFDPLHIDLDLSFIQLAADPFAAPLEGALDGAQAEPLTSQDEALNRLRIVTHLRVPWSLGRGGNLTLHASLHQLNDLFATPRQEDDPAATASATTPTRTAIRQRLTAWTALAWTAQLQGRPGGLRHVLRPTLVAYAAPVRVDHGDRDPVTQATPYTTERPLWALHAHLAQRLGRADTPHLDVDLGALILRDLEPTPDGLAHLSRLGVHVNAQHHRHGLRVDLAPQFTDTGVELASAYALLHTRAASPSPLTLAAGLAHITPGPRATLRPWQHNRVAAMPALFPQRITRELTGLTARARVPLPLIPHLALEASTLAPLQGTERTWGDMEVVGALTLGDVLRCLQLRLDAARRIAPDTWDVALNVRLDMPR